VTKLVMKTIGFKKSKGAVFIEFALVLVVFVPLLLGMIDYSIAFLNKMVITNASREGVRFAVTRPDPSSNNHNCQTGNAGVSAVVNSSIQKGLVTFGEVSSSAVVTTTPSTITGSDGLTRNACRVKVDYSYEGLFWFSSSTITAETVMNL
jgi:Flp pilus assembly protein TadG